MCQYLLDFHTHLLVELVMSNVYIFSIYVQLQYFNVHHVYQKFTKDRPLETLNFNHQHIELQALYHFPTELYHSDVRMSFFVCFSRLSPADQVYVHK